MTDAEVVYWYLGEAGPEGAGLTGLPAGEVLSPEEQLRFEGMRFPKRRSEWLLGRVSAKTLLKKCVPGLESVPFERITIANRAEGAPFVLLNGETLPLQLSISHREGLAAAAVCRSPEIGLGIDLEWVEDHPASFYEDFFTADEQKWLAALPVERRAWGGTMIWSAKESVLKALGKGLRLDTRTVDISGIARTTVDGWGTYDLRIASINVEGWHGAWRNIGPYLLTLAVNNKNTRPILKRVG